MCAYNNSEGSQINNLIFHLELLEKQELAKPKINRQKKIINIRAESNEMETKNTKYHGNKKLGH
jgi:hypothetical protein